MYAFNVAVLVFVVVLSAHQCREEKRKFLIQFSVSIQRIVSTHVPSIFRANLYQSSMLFYGKLLMVFFLLRLLVRAKLSVGRSVFRLG